MPLLRTQHLDSLPPRVLRFRLCLARFDCPCSRKTSVHSRYTLQIPIHKLSRATLNSRRKQKHSWKSASHTYQLVLRRLKNTADHKEKTQFPRLSITTARKDGLRRIPYKQRSYHMESSRQLKYRQKQSTTLWKTNSCPEILENKNSTKATRGTSRNSEMPTSRKHFCYN